MGRIRDSSPQRINVMTIDSEYQNCNISNYNRHCQESGETNSLGSGCDEIDAGQPSYSSNMKSVDDQDDEISIPVQVRSGGRRSRSSFNRTSLSPKQSCSADPSPSPSLDVDDVSNRATFDSSPSLRDQYHLETRTAEVGRNSENGDVRHSGLETYRDAEYEDGVEMVDQQNVDDDDDDGDERDSYGAYDTNDQLLDTLTEYQQKLEKTNFVDEVFDEPVEDPMEQTHGISPVENALERTFSVENTSPLEDRVDNSVVKPQRIIPVKERGSSSVESTTAPVKELERRSSSVPQHRRLTPTAVEDPNYTNPVDPESPSDSLDVSELEEDEYLEY